MKISATYFLFLLYSTIVGVKGVPDNKTLMPAGGLSGSLLASQARLFRAVAELNARESHEEEELLPELLQLSRTS